MSERIIELHAERFKRLQAIAIKPETGEPVVISGRNAQGKSSVLDAIESALAGKRVEPEKPIKAGSESARVVVETDSYVVTRRWTEHGSRLEVISKSNGLPMKSPQAVLDELTGGSLGFDPLNFARSDANTQALKLRQAIGLDVTKLVREREAAFALRTTVNRDATRIEARIGMAPAKPSDLEPLDFGKLTAEYEAAIALKSENEKTHNRLDEAQRTRRQREEELSVAEQELEDAKLREAAAQELVAHRAKEVEALVDPQVDETQEKLIGARAHNAAIELFKKHVEETEQLRIFKAQSDAFTRDLYVIDKKITAATAESVKALGISGLALGQDGVTLNGLPFSNLSQREQIVISMRIAAAQNPKLRVILIREGSCLDSETMKALAEWAASADVQVWIERVTDGEPVGIVIEDGYVSDATRRSREIEDEAVKINLSAAEMNGDNIVVPDVLGEDQ